MANRIGKDIYYLRKNLAKLTGHQAELEEIVEPVFDEEGPSIIVRLTPTTGYYKGQVIDFKLELREPYPVVPPVITCMSDIYHPNIDTSTISEGNVCLNLLEAEFWSPGFGIQGCIFGLLFLLENPNFDDPISPLFQPRDSLAEYAQDIENYRQGKSVGFMKCLLDEAISYFNTNVEDSAHITDGKDGKNLTNGENFDLVNGCSTLVSDNKSCDCLFCSDININCEPGDEDFASESQLTSNYENNSNMIDLRKRSHDYTLENLNVPLHAKLSETDIDNMDEKLTTSGSKTKRQISEDTIVSASSIIFQNASGECLQDELGKLRNDSVEGTSDFEELLYLHFDMDSEIQSE